jgi:L-asparaginase II
MNPFRVERTRGGIAESVHRVSAAVVDADGRLLAWAGTPDLITFWRSAAKPIQALPLIEDGVLDHYGLGSEELALACASHSSEYVHLAVAERFLARIGCAEDDLACGPHPPLGAAVARDVAEKHTVLTPRWSNCSGKHAGMLALARHHGWPTAGYQVDGHPVQDRLLQAIARWTGVPREQIVLAVDGCGTLCYALPLRGMALAYARLGVSAEPAAVAVRHAMLSHPDLIAGEGRLCTDLMRALPGQIIAKIGAEGIYSATVPSAGLGITLKVEDGDMRASAVALIGLLRKGLARLGGPALPRAGLEAYEDVPITNTRGVVTGTFRASGDLQFGDQG